MNLRQHGIAVNFSINGSNIEITLLLMIFLACLLRAHTKQQKCENNEKINWEIFLPLYICVALVSDHCLPYRRRERECVVNKQKKKASSLDCHMIYNLFFKASSCCALSCIEPMFPFDIYFLLNFIDTRGYFHGDKKEDNFLSSTIVNMLCNITINKKIVD